MSTEADTEAMLANPKFQKLVRARATLGWTLAAIMCLVYFGLVGVIAYDKPLVDAKVGGGPMSLGIVLGLVVIAIAIILVGIYVAIANARFDKMWAALERETSK